MARRGEYVSVKEDARGFVKRCGACNAVKPVAQFHGSNRRAGVRVPDGTFIQSKCKSCQVNDRRLGNRRNRLFLDSEKLRVGCVDCGYGEHAFALDFHHLHDKKFSLGSRYALQAPLRYLAEEITKCIVLCAICHRKRHHLGEINDPPV